MPTTLDTAATAELVRDLADLVCTKPDGTRWKSVSVTQMKNTCVRFCAEMARRAGGDLTLGELLTADMVEAYCDGETENRRNVGNRDPAACQSPAQPTWTRRAPDGYGAHPTW